MTDPRETSAVSRLIAHGRFLAQEEFRQKAMSHPAFRAAIGRALAERQVRLERMLDPDVEPFAMSELEVHLFRQAYGAAETASPGTVLGMPVTVADTTKMAAIVAHATEKPSHGGEG